MNSSRRTHPRALGIFSLIATVLPAQTLKPLANPPGAKAPTVQLDPLNVAATREHDETVAARQAQRAAPNLTSVAATAEFGPRVDSNPGEFLKYLPGVDIEPIAPGFSRYALRGLGPENTEILFDGLPLANMHADRDPERPSRRIDVSLMSAADIARVEVRKLPLPSDSANSLGGTINLIRRSAFDFNHRRITYQATVRADAQDITSEPLTAPGGHRLGRWRPNWQLAWTEPLHRDFGFSLSLGQDDLLLSTQFATPGWNLGTGANLPSDAVSIFKPALTSSTLLDAPQQQKKSYALARVDWRPRPALTINAELGVHDSRQHDKQGVYSWNVAAAGSGDVVHAHGATHTSGRPGGGAVWHNSALWREAATVTTSTMLAAKWSKDAWELSAKAGWSRAASEVSDTRNGYFGGTGVGNVPGLAVIPATGVGLGLANPLPITLDFQHTDGGLVQVDAWTARPGAINPTRGDYDLPLDWRSADVMRIGGARSRPGRAEEVVTSARVHAKRKFAFAAPTSVQLGMDWTERSRDRHYDYHAWRFVGADGIPGSSDDSAAPIGAGRGSARRDPTYGYPEPESISMSKLYRLFQEQPGWFRYEEARSEYLTLNTNSAYDLKEKIAAPYVEFETRIGERLRLNGGTRYERTTAKARGLLVDHSAGNGLTRGTLAHTRAVYRAKGATNQAINDGWFPSLHATHDFSPQVTLQAGYARTQGRIEYATVLIPNNQVSADPVMTGAGVGAIGQITLQNPNLQPWTSDNFEARVSWEFHRGAVALSGFQKHVRNFHPQIDTPPLSAGELESYAKRFPDAGLGAEHEGYSLRYRTNAGSARLDGAEFELRTSLAAWLPAWTRGFDLTGNLTYLNRKGPNGDELGLNRAWMGSANLRYAAGRLAIRGGYRFNGEQIVNAQVVVSGRMGQRIRQPQHLIDATIEYAVGRGVRVFVAGSNLTDELTIDEDLFPGKPAYANRAASRNVGTTCTIGLAGSF